MQRLKVAKAIRKQKYTPVRVARRIASMLEEPKFAHRAESVAKMLAREDGVKTACDALEQLLAKKRAEK
jgi:UDP:flavonoid glycosyltransferase YjiC (YdhE family)